VCSSDLLGIGDWAQSPIPNPHLIILIFDKLNNYNNINKKLN